MSRTRGASPIPNEAHRAHGTMPDRRKRLASGQKESRADGASHGLMSLPDEDEIQPLPSVEDVGVPDYPEGLGERGKELWDQAWCPEVIWLSPATDYRAVEHACFAYEAFLQAHENFMYSMQMGTDIRNVHQAWSSASRQFGEALNDIGLNPMARSRLGVAEVKKTLSKMEKLQQQFRKPPKKVGSDSDTEPESDAEG